MKIHQIAALLILVPTFGCGDAPSEDVQEVSIQIPWQVPLDNFQNCNWTALQGVVAELYVSGYEQAPCQLGVNQNLTVQGRCSGIHKGIERYLLLVYRMPAPGGHGLPDAHLSYLIGSVDLSPTAVSAETSEVNVRMYANDQTGALIYNPADFDALPSEPGETSLSRAQNWAKDQIGRINPTTEILDIDGDSCPNLQEVCAEGLFNMNILSACP